MLFSEQKDIVRNHYAKYFGFKEDGYMVYADKKEDFDPDYPQIDIMWIKPTKKCNYNILATCGLSQIMMNNPPQCMELIMLLPEDWRVEDKRDEYWWPVELLRQVAYTPYATGDNLTYGSVVSLTKKDTPFMAGTKNCGAIITMPEHFSPEMFELEVEKGLFLRFFQCVPVNKDDIEKIQENGVDKFIQFNLHNADGPEFVVKKN